MPGKRRKSDEAVDPEVLVRTALEIADTEDLEALTMRRLAASVGLAPMTLYGYFESKDALLDAMADHVLGQMEVADVPGDDPLEVVRQIGFAFFEVMAAHPSVIRLLATRSTTSHGSMAAAFEAPLRRLCEIGYGHTEAVRVYGLLFTLALGFSSYQLPRPWGSDDLSSAESRRQRELLYQALPIEQFPTMVKLSAPLVTLPSRQQFLWCLDVISAGLRPAPSQTPTTA
jgi:AcrR family transcriptional regulator